MAQHGAPSAGPDLAAGVPLDLIPVAGVLAGHVDGSAVLLTRSTTDVFAVGGTCTHYGAPLADGLLIADGVVRCPWHHACFSLRTGKALAAPAFTPLGRWQVDVIGDTVFVRAPMATQEAAPAAVASGGHPDRIVIVGGGAAGFAAAEKLRELGFAGSLTVLSADASAPCDRPNLSKDYLAGNAPEDWIPLRPDDFYRDRQIDLELACEVTAIDTNTRSVLTRSGQRFGYGALLLATGAEPVRADLPGFDLPNVFTLRSLGDARAIIAAATEAETVVLLGAGFVGMEAAAALRTRGLDVHVVARERVPLARVFGDAIGDFITRLHQDNGVVFHFGRSALEFDGRALTLDDGSMVAADLLIVGFGVKPRIGLAVNTGIAVEDGVLVDEYLQTSVPDIFAAGDIARFPRGTERMRIEHWVVAERQGQVAAQNMLGARHAFDDVPFFWTSHYGVDVRYVGHAQDWDDVQLDGSPANRSCTAHFFRDGQLLAAASIGRDFENLEIGEGLRAHTDHARGMKTNR
ncbi:MAG TPA: FAD-dependent oxidoreductase [Rhodanobacteraceae bacterium]|nr:FAD-dependent oxidoreductase [Rhodanobacteraceae bacterium]